MGLYFLSRFDPVHIFLINSLRFSHQNLLMLRHYDIEYMCRLKMVDMRRAGYSSFRSAIHIY
jgi:hypothetical protein